jgi:hypothetical protein
MSFESCLAARALAKAIGDKGVVYVENNKPRISWTDQRMRDSRKRSGSTQPSSCFAVLPVARVCPAWLGQQADALVVANHLGRHAGSSGGLSDVEHGWNHEKAGASSLIREAIGRAGYSAAVEEQPAGTVDNGCCGCATPRCGCAA